MSPLYHQMTLLHPQMSPLYPQMSPLHPQMSPLHLKCHHYTPKCHHYTLKCHHYTLKCHHYTLKFHHYTLKCHHCTSNVTTTLKCHHYTSNVTTTPSNVTNIPSNVTITPPNVTATTLNGTTTPTPTMFITTPNVTTTPTTNSTATSNVTNTPTPSLATTTRNLTTTPTTNSTATSNVTATPTPGITVTTRNFTTTSNTTATSNASAPTPIITSTTANVTTAPSTTANNSSTNTSQSTITPMPPVSTTNTIIIPATCPEMQCPPLSMCANSVCQCLAGTYMSQGLCIEAKVFPGLLHFLSIDFKPEMSNHTSELFRTTSDRIVQQLKSVFSSKQGYITSTVLELTAGSVVATVNNVFEPNSLATENSTNQAITDAIKNNIIQNASFTPTNLCAQNPPPCDAGSTICSSANGTATCSCMPGYILTGFSERICKACPSGQQAVNQNCVPCAFGYSGFNCNDSSLLALVVVAVVLGAILLIIILALLICCVVYRSKRISNHNSPYSTDFATWRSHAVTPIPRASLGNNTNSEAYQTEMPLPDSIKPNNGLMGSYDLMPLDDMKTFKGKNPPRYSYLVEGHENPYFNSDEQTPQS
ncbi:mucin-13 isoform X2 [Silurus meridionalis]|uniref:mucin-13 isoform X2 n=1 Tax=Silurus meridionalis TaxID=175797 RepID=UPI001EEAD419|nr:mucin-13 isoform X2 [Silurus meridionalis]